MARHGRNGGGGSSTPGALAAVDEALSRGDCQAALEAAEKAAADAPDDAEIIHARGVALRGLGRLEEALDAFSEAAQVDPELADVYLDAVEILVDDLRDEIRALDVLRTAERHLTDPAVLGEVALLRGVALAHLQDLSGALTALEDAQERDPDNPDVSTEMGNVLLDLLRFEESEAAFRRSLELAEENARAQQLLAFVLDYTGRRDEAKTHFQRAAGLDKHLPAEPPRLSEKAFDEAVERALKSIPARFAEHLKNVETSVENYAAPEFCRRQDCSPMTLGIYVGTPLTLRGDSTRQLPDRIILFQRAIENVCHDEAEVVREIGTTLKHEIGHFLGFNEQELIDRGYE